MESSIGRGGFGGSLGALRSDAVAKERNLAVLDSQRDEEVSILFLRKIPGLSFDSLRKNYTCDYLIGSVAVVKWYTS